MGRGHLATGGAWRMERMERVEFVKRMSKLTGVLSSPWGFRGNSTGRVLVFKQSKLAIFVSAWVVVEDLHVFRKVTSFKAPRVFGQH
jgi:hypothetical protein